MNKQNILIIVAVVSVVVFFVGYLDPFTQWGVESVEDPPIAVIGLSNSTDAIVTDNRTTVHISHNGGDKVLSEDVELFFEVYLGGRDSPSAEFVKGDVNNLSSSPSIEWDIVPTVTTVSVANALGDLEVGRSWDIVFEVENPDYFVDVTRLSLVHTPSNTLLFISDFSPPYMRS